MARGRSRRNGRRHPNGRLAKPTTTAEREASKEDMTKVAKEARVRVYGVPRSIAGHQYAGDALGRLCLAGVDRGGISMRQREAGAKYAEIVWEYEHYLAFPRPVSGSQIERHGGHDNSNGDEPDYVAAYERAKGRYNRAVRAVAMAHDPLALGALNKVVLQDIEEWGQIGALRTALNAIAHEFSTELLGDKDEAA